MTGLTALIDLIPYADYLIAILTMVGSGIFAYLIARSQGEKAAQKYLITEQYRSAHQKNIVAETMASWKKTLSEPRKILYIERADGESLRVDFSPFLKNPQVSYFESHLKTGYKPLWTKIQTWKDSYSKLVSKVAELADRTRRYMEEPNILPRYDRIRSSEEYINYAYLVYSYFHTVSLELEGLWEFEVKVSESMSGQATWFRLKFAPTDFADFATSPNREKILQLKKIIEEFHNDEKIFNEFENIFFEGERLNGELKGMLEELERVWAEVYNNVPLQGWCEAGVKGKYEREQE